ncbi:hypothetical protein C8Q80DRAFT_1125031 [Daedaleopsis nitida]|nr:hypothetical protein C8Q80DRAFT_1125031 [Daedaleopsis nitida]
MSSTSTVAILEGTGELGGYLNTRRYHISTMFLTEYRHVFSAMRTTRDPSAKKAQQLAAKSAEIHALSEPLDTDGASMNKELAISLLKNEVKVYFPSEFGSDHRIVDFPGFEHQEWTGKRAVDAEIRALTCLGTSINNIATTDLADIGRAVAQVSVLALDQKKALTVSDVLRIGQNVSIQDIRDTVLRVKGVPPGEITVEDLMAELLARDLPGAAREYPPLIRVYTAAHCLSLPQTIRVNIGDGNMDFTVNSNELVNPGENLWK